MMVSVTLMIDVSMDQNHDSLVVMEELPKMIVHVMEVDEARKIVLL